jgi:hypothetical protein
MTTIVSAFLSGINTRHPVDSYLKRGQLLIDSPHKKIIFMDRKYIDNYQNNETTIFMPFSIEEMALYPYRDLCDKQPERGDKDNMLYMFLQNEKTEFLRKAIEMNPYYTSNFIWLDFGILDYLVKELPDKFPIYDKVRIASIWDLNNHGSCLDQVLWFFAGSVVGGNKDELIKFADFNLEKCICIIKAHHQITWEVNMWKMIYDINPELFDPYYCDHNQTIISRY